MNTYGYVRVSTLQQANEGDSLETQLRQIKSYSELKGYPQQSKQTKDCPLISKLKWELRKPRT